MLGERFNRVRRQRNLRARAPTTTDSVAGDADSTYACILLALSHTLITLTTDLFRALLWALCSNIGVRHCTGREDEVCA